jgi:transposase
MARAYSLDLRERVVAAVADGLSRRAVADRFGVSVVASVVKWSQRLRATGSWRPSRWAGGVPSS